MAPVRFALALSALLAGAAAPAPDPLLERVIDGARAVAPETIAFERTIRDVSTEAGGKTETRTIVDRWDGRQLTMISNNGKPPTAAEAAAYARAGAGRPLSSYARIAAYLARGARRVADAQGRTVYRIEPLPKGSVDIGRDISTSMAGEAIVDAAGPVPYVTRLRLTLTRPMSFFLVAKLDALDIVNDYRLGPGGRPALVHQSRTLTGAQFGKAGTTRTDVTFVPQR